jgi:hypothetical protein
MTDTWAPMDPLGEALHLLRMNGAYYCRSELTAPWGLDLPPMRNHLWFHVVTAGHALLQTADGEPVMQYLTRWRMHLALDALKRERVTAAELARRFGYRSEAAFARAFKRVVGLPPGSVRPGLTDELVDGPAAPVDRRPSTTDAGRR